LHPPQWLRNLELLQSFKAKASNASNLVEAKVEHLEVNELTETRSIPVVEPLDLVVIESKDGERHQR
jgi:hypothetical protein